MKSSRRLACPSLLAAIVATLLSCATTQEKTESFLFADPGRLAPPIDAWLRTVEVVSNSLPMSEDYALISDTLVAIASKHGFQLSVTRAHQPYIVDLVVHERSSVVDLSTRNSVMAVMNVSTSSESPVGVARVVHSAVSSDSIVSLYQVTEVGEKVFASLRAAVDERMHMTKDAANAKPPVASAP